MASKNLHSNITKAYLKTSNPLNPKWYVCFKYKNSLGEQKIYQKTYDLNKSPFVNKGVVSQKPSILKERKRLADEYVRELNSLLHDVEFDVDRNIFVEDAKDILFIQYLNDYIAWKCNKVKGSSIITYQSVVNEIIKYLHLINEQNVSLKNVDVHLIEKIVNQKQELSNSRANYYLTVLSNFYKKYLIKYLAVLSIDENIIDRLERFKEDDTSKHAIYSDVQQAFTDLTNHKFHLGYMAKVIYYTLHRMDTITQLQYKDFDIEQGVINIPSDKIKTSKKLTIRISKHLLPTIKEAIESLKPKPHYYFFGNSGMIKNEKGQDTYNIEIFGEFKTPTYTISHHFDEFKKKKTTNKELFTKRHTLYGMKANGYTYYKNGGDKKQFILSDEQIIKITGHTNTDILKKYSREYEATISKEIWESL